MRVPSRVQSLEPLRVMQVALEVAMPKKPRKQELGHSQTVQVVEFEV